MINSQALHGLVEDHAYTALGVVETDGNKLIKMRNPWASEQYTGAWCDSCEEWTDKTKTEAGWTDANDGVFFMTLSDYYETFS